jgi:biopolymer transport protein ExbB/TolQ
MDFSLVGLWSQMGFIAKAVVIMLLGMSMWAIGIALERFLTFSKGRRRSLEFIAALQPHLGPKGKLEDAAKLDTEFDDAPLARVIMSGLKEFRQGISELGAAATDSVELELLVHSVARTMDRAKKREMAGLSKGLPVLATIASSAPFVGLFGTVFGIITAFQLMADPTAGGGGLATVSAGIAEALLTTAVGLAVAIGAVWFFNYFTTKLEEMAGLVDDATGELVDRLAHKTRRANLELGNATAVHTSPRASYVEPV